MYIRSQDLAHKYIALLVCNDVFLKTDVYLAFLLVYRLKMIEVITPSALIPILLSCLLRWIKLPFIHNLCVRRIHDKVKELLHRSLP